MKHPCLGHDVVPGHHEAESPGLTWGRGGSALAARLSQEMILASSSWPTLYPDTNAPGYWLPLMLSFLLGSPGQQPRNSLSHTHTHVLYPFICWWALRFLPCLGYCKHSCDEHSPTFDQEAQRASVTCPTSSANKWQSRVLCYPKAHVPALTFDF